MQRIFALLTAIAFAAPAFGQTAPIVQTNEQKIGKQVVTEVRQLEPAKNPPEPMSASLESKDWKCGQQFTDQLGRVWRMSVGPADSAKGPQQTGWIVTSPDNRTMFITTQG